MKYVIAFIQICLSSDSQPDISSKELSNEKSWPHSGEKNFILQKMQMILNQGL